MHPIARKQLNEIAFKALADAGKMLESRQNHIQQMEAIHEIVCEFTDISIKETSFSNISFTNRRLLLMSYLLDDAY